MSLNARIYLITNSSFRDIGRNKAEATVYCMLILFRDLWSSEKIYQSLPESAQPISKQNQLKFPHFINSD